MPRHYCKLLLLSVLSGIFLPCAAARAQTDPLIEGAKRCTRFLPHYEMQYGIPVHLLSAISSTESGRWHDGLKISLPWPWTINADGKGYYLHNKEEAIATAKKLRARGVKSMDVGCMQINLIHHPRAFANLEEAFDPDKNIAYGASFLRGLYESEGNWKSAAAAYHSKTPSLGSQYVSSVYNRWYTIINKLRLAKSLVTNADAHPPATAAKAEPTKAAVYRVDAKANLKPVTTAQLGEQRGMKLSQQAPVRMKIIKVAESKPKPENGIIVLRPEKSAPAPAASANAASARTDNIINIADVKPSAAAHAPTSAAVTGGPRFIFTD